MDTGQLCRVPEQARHTAGHRPDLRTGYFVHAVVHGSQRAADPYPAGEAVGPPLLPADHPHPHHRAWSGGRPGPVGFLRQPRLAQSFYHQILHLPKLNINYTVPGLILFYLWHYFPYTALTTLATLEGLDRSIEEAASVTGANGWQVLRHIVLPLIAPGILAGSVLTFMAAFGSFSIPLVTGGNYRPLSVAIYTQIESFTPARWSMGSAMSVVMAILQVTFLSIYMRVLRRPIT
ncbi:MAG TPA: ABC transporter permease subunit [Anaerolineae bacterium]|nr:ABC transporter permease subunit [Anaerolineae bacterium]